MHDGTFSWQCLKGAEDNRYEINIFIAYGNIKLNGILLKIFHFYHLQVFQPWK